MITDPVPQFRSRLRSGQKLVGSWVSMTDAIAVEIMCQAGFDFLIIDAEHGALGIETIQQQVMVANLMSVPALVRIPWNEPVIIKRVLDLGANGILVPLSATAEDVERAVAAANYPPAGIRGFGPRRPSRYGRLFREYIEVASESVLVFIQIEQEEAVRNLDSILKVQGVDALLIGSNDLSGSIGLLGQPRAPEVLQLIDETIQKGAEVNMTVGAASGSDPELVADWFKRGAQFVAMGGDFMFLAQAADAALHQAREQLQEASTQE